MVGLSLFSRDGLAELINGYDSVQDFEEEQRLYSEPATSDEHELSASQTRMKRFAVYKLAAPVLGAALVVAGVAFQSRYCIAAAPIACAAIEALAYVERAKLLRRRSLQERIKMFVSQQNQSPETLHDLEVKAGPSGDIRELEKGIAYCEGGIALLEYHSADEA